MKHTINTINKKILFICLLCVLCGCNNTPQKIDINNVNVNQEYDLTQELMEYEDYNAYSDLKSFSDLKNIYVDNLKILFDGLLDPDFKADKYFLIINNYMLDVYKLANARLIADIDKIYNVSDEYKSYLLLCQAYVDYYNSDYELLQNEIAKGNVHNDLDALNTFKNLEYFYNGLLKQYEEFDDVCYDSLLDLNNLFKFFKENRQKSH